jgi:DNA uptake protein ComE-like DNA-binding protein
MARDATRCRPSARSGVALVTVLWLMTVLCAVALQVGLYCRLRLQLSRNVGDGVKALFLARGGIERAVADLKANRDGVVAIEDLRGEDADTYCNARLHGGTYTLLAEPARATAEAEYGICDESARLNLNRADQEMLQKLPGLDARLAAAIVSLREGDKRIEEIEDLLLIEILEPDVLYGEDQNENGILDLGEDDGDESWPPDDADGRLDTGLAALLTCNSAVRNVTNEGAKRVNINKADEQQLRNALPDISEDQAYSIVEQRKKGQFESVAGLLDVMLTKKPDEKESGEQKDTGQQDGRSGNQQSGPPPGEKKQDSGQQKSDSASKKESEAETTDEKAFNVDEFKAVADLVTITDDEILPGLVNVNTAPAEVLACLPGVDRATALAIVNRRNAAPFESVADLLDVEGMNADAFKQLCNLIAVRSDVFSVRAFGVVGGGDRPVQTRCCVRAVIDRTGDRIRLTSWRELR